MVNDKKETMAEKLIPKGTKSAWHRLKGSSYCQFCHANSQGFHSEKCPVSIVLNEYKELEEAAEESDAQNGIIDTLNKVIEFTEQERNEARIEVKRYREALEYYANKDNWKTENVDTEDDSFSFTWIEGNHTYAEAALLPLTL